jgi:integrase
LNLSDRCTDTIRLTPVDFNKYNASICFLANALQTGIRWGEILALKWSDIDLDEGGLHVNCTDSFGHIVELVSGRRTVPLTSSLNEVLRSHRKIQAEEARIVGRGHQDFDLVVARPDGTSLSTTTLNIHWKKLLKESGLPKISLHDLRSTFFKFMSEIVMNRIAHITLDTYAHLYQQQQPLEELAQRFHSFLHGDIDD